MQRLTIDPSGARLGSGPAVTPMAFVRAITTAYSQRGLSADAALEVAQIAPAHIEDESQTITARQLELLSGAAMKELDDEALGWFSRRLPWGSYGMLVRASISAPTLGLAMQRWCRHHGLLTDDLSLSLNRDGSHAHLCLQENRPLGQLREFCLVSMLRNFHGVACWLIDSRIPLASAIFPFPAPRHQSIYPVLFGPEVSFDGTQGEIAFDASYLDLPLRRDEQALQRLLSNPLPLTVLQYRRDRLLVQSVRQVLSAHPGSMRNAQHVASHLALSVRTLHRLLREEGASLQGLRDEVRHASACQSLLRTQRSVKQIASDCGFTNEKSFTRAFKSWQGCSPGAFRDQALAPRPAHNTGS